MTVSRYVPVGDFRIGPVERQAILDVLDSGHLSEGPKVADFENAFAEYIGCKHAIAVNSGTSALIVMLRALWYRGNGAATPGGKVITSPLTFVATPAAIDAAGFEPLFVDVDPRRFHLCSNEVERALDEADETSAFAAILPVHLMGYPADLDSLTAVADKHGLLLLEDSAQAHGTTYQGRRTGSIGLAGAFSFYIAHNIQAGEMGAVTTNDAEMAQLIHSLKAHGRRCRCRVCRRREGLCPYIGREDEGDPRFTHDFIGYNFKTMEFQATLGLCQLRRADEIFAARQHHVRMLNDLLADFADELELPAFDDNVSYLAYPIVVRESARIGREHLRHELEKLGVESRPLFSCLPTQQPAFRHIRAQYEGRLPNAERLGRQAFYIGCHQFLNDDDLAYVAASFRKVLDEAAGG